MIGLCCVCVCVVFSSILFDSFLSFLSCHLPLYVHSSISDLRLSRIPGGRLRHDPFRWISRWRRRCRYRKAPAPALLLLLRWVKPRRRRTLVAIGLVRFAIGNPRRNLLLGWVTATISGRDRHLLRTITRPVVARIGGTLLLLLGAATTAAETLETTKRRGSTTAKLTQVWSVRSFPHLFRWLFVCF